MKQLFTVACAQFFIQNIFTYILLLHCFAYTLGIEPNDSFLLEKKEYFFAPVSH